MAQTLRQKPDEAVRSAQQTIELATQDKAKLTARLAPGILEGLVEDHALLGETQSGATAARVQRKAATQEQNEVAARTQARVQTVRDVCKRTGVKAEILKALGVGHKMTTAKVSTVVAGADLLVAAYQKYPDAFRGAGVLPEDIDTITGLRNALRTADAGQETKKVTAKDKTATRKAVQARVEAAIDKIIAAADLALVDQPDRLALYHAVLPSRGRKAAAPKPAPAA